MLLLSHYFLLQANTHRFILEALLPVDDLSDCIFEQVFVFHERTHNVEIRGIVYWIRSKRRFYYFVLDCVAATSAVGIKVPKY